MIHNVKHLRFYIRILYIESILLILYIIHYNSEYVNDHLHTSSKILLSLSTTLNEMNNFGMYVEHELTEYE